MPREKMGGKNLQCMLCTSKPPPDVLRKHIKFQHMIEKDSAVDKIYDMHFPKELVSIDTQTTMTWINQLEDLEQSIATIAENVEKVSETSAPSTKVESTEKSRNLEECKVKRAKKSLTSMPEPDLEDEDIPEVCVSPKVDTQEQEMKFDEMLNPEYDLTLSPTTSEIGANPDAPEPMMTTPSQDINTPEPEEVEEDARGTTSLNSLLHSGSISISKIDEDDDPVIIHEKKVDYSDTTYTGDQSIELGNIEDDEPVIIEQKKADLFDSDSSSSSLAEIPKEENKDLSMDQDEEITKETHEEIEEIEDVEDDEMVGSIVPENIKESFPTWIRYRCPYCDFVDFKKYVVDDHVIIQHSDVKYGEAKKQEMYVGIERDSSLATLLKVYYKNYDVSDGTDIMIDDEDNSKEEVVLGDFSEVNDEIASNIEESFLEDEPEWERSDATLPIGWLFNDSLANDGKIEKSFMSPCKRKFSSRDKVAEFLMDQGKKIIRAGGFKVPDTEKSKCDAMCEGNCKLFVVPKSFYHPKDKNKIRKKTKLKFINESQVPKANRAKDKMVKGVPKFKLVPGIRYKGASQKVTRPWLLLIEESDTQEPNRNPRQEHGKGKISAKVSEVKKSFDMDLGEKSDPPVIKENDAKKSGRVSRKSITNTSEEESEVNKIDEPIEQDKVKDVETSHSLIIEEKATPPVETVDTRKSSRPARKSVAVTPLKESKLIDEPVEEDKVKDDEASHSMIVEEKATPLVESVDTRKSSRPTRKSVAVTPLKESKLIDEPVEENKVKDVETSHSLIVEEKATPPVETVDIRKTSRPTRKSVAVTPVKESMLIAIVDKDDNTFSEVASISKALDLDIAEKDEHVPVNKGEMKPPSRVTRKSTSETFDEEKHDDKAMKDAMTAASPLKDVKEKKTSPVKKLENKRGSRVTRKSITELSAEENSQTNLNLISSTVEPKTVKQDEISVEIDVQEKEILPVENVDMNNSTEVTSVSTVDNAPEGNEHSIISNIPDQNVDMETSKEEAKESQIPDSLHQNLVMDASEDEKKISDSPCESVGMDTSVEECKESKISDKSTEYVPVESSTEIVAEGKTTDTKTEEVSIQPIEKLLPYEKPDNKSAIEVHDEPEVERNPSESTHKVTALPVAQPEIEDDDVSLLQKTPTKKREKQTQVSRKSIAETEEIIPDITPQEDVKNDSLTTIEKEKADDLLSESEVSSENICIKEPEKAVEIPVIDTKPTEVQKEKAIPEKDLGYMQMEDESQQENEIVIIPDKSISDRPAEYKPKIEVPVVMDHSEDSVIDKLKESEMISISYLKESSLVELKLDDIEKVFASTDVEKSKEETEVKSKQEVSNATDLSSVNVEKSKDPCNINIEELNLVPEVPKRIEELKHHDEPQAMKNTDDPLKNELPSDKASTTSKRRRSQESTSRTGSPASKKRRPTETINEENNTDSTETESLIDDESTDKKLPKTSSKLVSKDFSSESEIKKIIGSKSKKTIKNESDSDHEQNVKRNIEKLKRLQKKEIEINKNEGTYVQCCTDTCLKWRLVREFEDPSMVPEYWTCSMNSDPRNNVCGVGGHAFMSDADTVDVKFTCGSMVWAKMKGFPWWPGMVDYCPDCEEYYWIEEDISLTEPAWYNVVFFEGKGNSVSRAWVKKEDIMKITLPVQPPKNTIKSAATRNKLTNAIKMATDAKMMTREERLEKYSFAALFRGKWGTYVDLESDTEENPAKKKKLIKRVSKDDERKGKITIKEKFITDAGNTTDKTKVSSIKKELVLKSTPDTATYEGGEPEKKSESRPEDDNPIASTSKDVSGRESLKFVYKSKEFKKEGTEKKMKTEAGFGKPIKKTGHWEITNRESSYQKPPQENSSLIAAQASRIVSPKKSTILGNLKYVNKALEDAQKNKYAQEATEDEYILQTNPHLDKNHPKPPLPSDVLIALAVRNLDPNNHYGASFRSIIAFLTLHFPYFNRNVEECKDMVRRAYDINSREETGKENFRIKSTLVEQLSVRIKSYVERSKGMVKQAMLQAEFLDTIVERFVHGTKSNPACNFRPPYSCKMLSYLALVSICPPCSIEQIMIFITFLFPSLQNDKTAFKKEDFENAIRNDDNVEEFYLPPNGQRMFILREGSYPIVLNSVRQFFGTKSNNIRLKKSIYKQEFVNILLPNLITEDDPVETEMK